MSNNKQSSVDWLISQLQISTYWKYLIMEVELMECGEIDIIKQAKAMHKEEMLYAIEWGNRKGYDEHKLTCIYDEDEQYYKEVFGGNND